MILVALVLGLTLQTQPKQAPEMRLMRFPTVHGDHVVFTYAGDLWESGLSGGDARRLTSYPGLEQKAYFSPDGTELAFTGQYDGNTDVYVMPSDGGEPKRLTYETGSNICAGWTPDGKVAYISTYGSFNARQARLWLVDPKGGSPLATPIMEASDIWYSPDGHEIAYDRQPSNRFNWRRYRGGSQGVISIYDLVHNTYRELPHELENDWNPMWVGGSIYYVSDKNENTVNLYRYDIGSGQSEQLTHYSDFDIHWPSTDGKTIAFERNGYLYTYDIAGHQVNRVNPEVRGDMMSVRPQLRHLGPAISAIALSPSGVRVVAEARGHIFSIPAHTGETRDYTNDNAGSRARFPDWSPDGKTVAFISDRTGEYQIYTVPEQGGDATQVTDYKGPSIAGISWAPDSEHIAFTTAGLDLDVVDVKSKTIKTVFTDPYSQVSSYDFSPDSKWIAYIGTGNNEFGSLYLYNMDSGKATQVTSGFYNDSQVAFDLNGKYLYLVSDRTYNPVPAPFNENLFLGATARVYLMTLQKDTKNPLEAPDEEEPSSPEHAKGRPAAGPPAGGAGASAPSAPPEMKIDLDGLSHRMVPLPLPAETYGGIVGADNGVFIVGPGALAKYDLTSRAIAPVFVGAASQLTLNPARTKLGYFSGGSLGIVDIHPGPPSTPGEGKVDTTNVEAVIDPVAEWKQIFWEAWRFERDHFYDKNFLGLDWNAIGKQYASYLPYVQHRSDLNYVLGLMIGEWGTSHAYVGGGDYGVNLPTINTGELGADYEVANGKVRFQKIYRGEDFSEVRRGPLSDPGVNVKEGDYLLAVDGQPVDAWHSPDSLLVDKANKDVVLTIAANPNGQGSHEVTVRPVADESTLRYTSWVEATRKYVDEKSGGRIGYIHVPDTSEPGMSEFLEGFYSQSDKDAVIIDERWNSGGNIPTFFTEWLGRKYRAYVKSRWGGDVGFPTQTLPDDKVMLINGYSGSGGDLFPWLFRQAHLGPLIGERTWGGLVGINGSAPLVDGGFLTAPGFGLFDPSTGKWIAENRGIDPDIPVDDRPDLIAKGQDPQLDTAIDYLMKELKDHPPVKIKEPTYPTVPHYDK